MVMAKFIRGKDVNFLEGEIWKDIPNYNGLYMVSNFGRIKSLKRKYVTREWLLTPSNDSSGYPQIVLVSNRVCSTTKIHTIVAVVFIGDRPIAHEINHINGVKEDNRVENLEYVTKTENLKHSFRIGLSNQKADKHHGRKLHSSQVFEIHNKYKPNIYTRKMLADEYGVSVATIKKIINKTNWSSIW